MSAIAQRTDAMAKVIAPVMKTRRRPYRSATGSEDQGQAVDVDDPGLIRYPGGGAVTMPGRAAASALRSNWNKKPLTHAAIGGRRSALAIRAGAAACASLPAGDMDAPSIRQRPRKMPRS